MQLKAGILRIITLCLTLLMLAGCAKSLVKTDHQTILEQPVRTTEAEQSKLAKVIPGNENLLLNYLHLLNGKRVGLLTNPSGVDRMLRATADILAAHPEVQLTALFGPEHGIRGAIYAGESIGDEKDARTGLPVYSLYGDHRAPTGQMLKNIDLMLVDIQDIGLRGYTYIYSMAKVMQAAAKYDKEVIVLDRPNPIGGIQVEGNLVMEGFYSFVGLYPIPYRHGMTIGELAQYFNIEFDIKCKLTVIPALNWRREMLWPETGLPWVAPSPHVPHWETILFMGATGVLGELHALSEGVGYTAPFEIVGAPWIQGRQLADSLNNIGLPGVRFRPLYYKPYYATYQGEVCQGVQLYLTERTAFNSYSTGLQIIQTIMKLYPDHNLFSDKERVDMFNKVVGCDWIMIGLKNGISVRELESKWQRELEDFKQVREKYLIY
jgi:uncharacterized protein YbbC (DUF1343 family)